MMKEEKKGMIFTKQPLKRLIKNCGAKRVSDDAALRLGQVVETFASEVLAKAGDLAVHSNRKTILKDDIRMIVRHGTGSDKN